MDSSLRSENLLDQVGSFGETKCGGCGLMDEGCNCAKECGVSILIFCVDCLSSAYDEAVSISLRTWNALKSCIFVLL